MKKSPDNHAPEHTREEPSFQFRGGYIPAEIFNLLRDGEMTKTDLLLCLIVDAMVRCRGEGCWASNGYLASQLGIASNYVSDSIRKLSGSKLRILKVEMIHGRRYLEVSWSRIDGENERQNTSPDNSVNEYRKISNGQKTSPEKPVTDLQKNLEHNIRTKSKKKTHGRSQAHDGARSVLFPDKDKSTETRFDRECSDKLYQAIEEFVARRGKGKMRKMPRKALGPAQFALLRKELDQDKARITTVLDWYCIHLGDQYVTTALCAKSFRERFDDIEIQMERSQRPKRSKTNGNGYDHSHDPNRLQPWEMEIDPRENELQPWEMGIDPRFNQIDENGR